MVASAEPARVSRGIARTVSFVVDPDTLHPALRFIRDYWNGKRGSRAMPARADIDPWELRGCLPRLFMVDILPGTADYRFRLLGTEITERYGRDSTGKTLREVYGLKNPQVYETILSMYATLRESRRPVLAIGTLSVIGKDFISYESLHLPLSDDDARVNIVLGLVQFDTDETRARMPLPLAEP